MLKFVGIFIKMANMNHYTVYSIACLYANIKGPKFCDTISLTRYMEWNSWRHVTCYMSSIRVNYVIWDLQNWSLSIKQGEDKVIWISNKQFI